jgi:protein-tyrosine phosphatase
MAEAFLRKRLEARGIDAHVGSAGFVTRGEPASDPAIVVVRDRYGLELDAHRSRRIDKKLITRADLIIGLARRHVFEVARERPKAFARAFTLKELVRRAEDRGGRARAESFDAFLARMHEGRTPNDLWGESSEDDVDDPIGLDHGTYRRIAAEIDGLVERLVVAVWADEGSPRRETA